ncbi:hypothetical protein BGX33_009246 [Mortierella sp. NVP41]|nr:hypothetical protein BGX33_009246 [Mortierella sp. NVP41]
MRRMSVVRISSRSRNSSDAGSPAPRIRVGYKRQSDIPDSMSQSFSQGVSMNAPSNRDSMYRPSSTYSNSSRDLLQHHLQHQHHQQQQQGQGHHHHQQQQQLLHHHHHQSSPHRVAHSPTPPQLPPLVEMDQQLHVVADLLTETVLLPKESIVDSSPFLSVNRLELYDQDPSTCAQILRDERKRILDRRQAIEMEEMKQETAHTLLKVEETKVHSLELATETLAIAPESLAPLSQSRTKLLDDLGNILSKIRGLLETVHIQYEEELEIQQQRQLEREQKQLVIEQRQRHHFENSKEEAGLDNRSGTTDAVVRASIDRLRQLEKEQQQHQEAKQYPKTPVAMDIFQMHGLMDLYDRDPEKCIELLRVEHARLAARRDELELEYERQRTALLRTMQR